MKNVLLLILFFIFCQKSFAQAPNWLWAEGGANSGYGYTAALTIDTSGNLFLTGRTGGSMTLGGKTLNTSGTVPFTSKFDGAGNGIFLNSNYSISSFAYADGIAIDSKDNSYITSCDQSGQGVYIQAFNNAGNLAWQYYTPNSNCRGYGIVADNFGNIYSAGHYTGSSITFGTTTLPNPSAYSGYIIKQDTAGNFKWATYFTSTSGNYNSGKHVVVDQQSNVYMCGAYQGTATFYSANGGPTITTSPSVATGGFSDLCVAKYDSTGKVLWVTTVPNAGLGYNSYGYGNVIAIDSCSNIYVGGIFQNTAQFGSISVTSTGGNDVFVGKYNTYAQQWEWVQTGGSSGADYLTAITLDKNSDVYVTGDFASIPAVFGSSTLSSGSTFVAKYANSNGALQWIQTATCNGIGGIAVNKQENVYISGGVNGSATFGSQNVNTGGNGDFIAELDTAPQRTILPGVLLTYCPGSTLQLPYTITGTFNAGNHFTAQLSNDSGSFVSPVNLGDTLSNSSGSITITIPLNTPPGSNYLIRVISSSPGGSSWANGCGAYYKNNVYTNDFYVTIGGNLSAKITNDTTICSGASVQLNVLAGGTFAWSPGSSLNDSTIANPIATPSSTQTYSVTIKSGTCQSSASVIVSVNPSVTITASPHDTTICTGMSVTLNSAGGSTYVWSPAASLSNSTIANPVATPTASTTYTVTGASGCSTTDTAIVNVGNAAIGGTVVALRDTLCDGTRGNLALTGFFGSPFQWQSSSTPGSFTDIPSANDTLYQTQPLSQSTWYRVVVGAGNCVDTSKLLELFVPPALVADFTTTQSGKTINFNSSPSKGNIVSYGWTFGDGTGSTVQNPSHTYNKTDTTYNVCLSVYDGSNCSYTFCKDVSFNTGIEPVSAQTNWNIYPNPFNDQLIICEKMPGDRIESIEIYDVLGRTVINKTPGSPNNNYVMLDVSNLVQGMYYLKINTGETDYLQKIVKQ